MVFIPILAEVLVFAISGADSSFQVCCVDCDVVSNK